MSFISTDQLPNRLAQRLDPVYLIAGEEPLLVEEALGALRERVRAAGFGEREVLSVEAGFDWSRLAGAAENLSLFAERRLIELRLPQGKPGQEGTRALQAFAKAPPADTVLVVICGRLDSRQRSAAWVKALAGAGVVAYAWPVRSEALPRWAAARLRQRGLTADPEALDLLAERGEGNLLALSQEIDKLALLAGGGHLDVATVRGAVGDSARFAIFDLPEAALAGGLARTARICRGLREEGEEPVLVLWALARELRVLAELQESARLRRSPDAVFGRHRTWRNRQGALWELARRAPAGAWVELARRTATADRVVKGAAAGRPWDELLQLSTDIARLAAAAGSDGKRP
ncbi:DNA polymerase III subunit delta [Sediminicurvatus halobius]|uniref:DNA polymerase III subunit delta n=1 Tax=Sediminicurvatus halobius TaxID=2182432 RepID=A0A2U2N4E4_9GAMM|nr:DNA polymerase III subunit delta [Spiribacter halobius]PWG64105.1 DNA polymerase III subunit delta [Spiribacter halobius]PWG65266.1 DNA polymerase III subunit delta [Spiribacter halobius]UEX78778.1 DNA polymerase III subunit delta [Spiribacter halobius]